MFVVTAFMRFDPHEPDKSGDYERRAGYFATDCQPTGWVHACCF
jgi:hypothetical protein